MPVRLASRLPRLAETLRPGGLLIYNTLRVNPSTVAAGFATYPLYLLHQTIGSALIAALAERGSR